MSYFAAPRELPKQISFLCFFIFFAPHFFLLKAEKKRVCFGRRNGVEPRARLSGLLVKLLRILFVERSNFVQKAPHFRTINGNRTRGRRRASGGVPCGGQSKGRTARHRERAHGNGRVRRACCEYLRFTTTHAFCCTKQPIFLSALFERREAILSIWIVRKFLLCLFCV